VHQVGKQPRLLGNCLLFSEIPYKEYLLRKMRIYIKNKMPLTSILIQVNQFIH